MTKLYVNDEITLFDGKTSNPPPPLFCWTGDPGSWIGKKPGSGTNIKHPQLCQRPQLSRTEEGILSFPRGLETNRGVLFLHCTGPALNTPQLHF